VKLKVLSDTAEEGKLKWLGNLCQEATVCHTLSWWDWLDLNSDPDRLPSQHRPLARAALSLALYRHINHWRKPPRTWHQPPKICSSYTLSTLSRFHFHPSFRGL